MLEQYLRVLPERLAIVRLGPEEPVPEWATGALVSVTRTPAELSIVCPTQGVPPDVKAEVGWRCFEVVGPLDLTEVGVLASITAPLRDTAIPVFVVSTYDTDYILVREAQLGAASAALTDAGHSIL